MGFMFQAHMQWRNFTMAIPPCCYTEEVCNHMKAIEDAYTKMGYKSEPNQCKAAWQHPQQEAAEIKLLIRPCVEIDSMSRGPSTFIPGCTPRMLVLVLAPRTYPYSIRSFMQLIKQLQQRHVNSLAAGNHIHT
jgi:hypothetical protein